MLHCRYSQRKPVAYNNFSFRQLCDSIPVGQIPLCPHLAEEEVQGGKELALDQLSH